MDEASIFFGQVRHEYGGNLDRPQEFCARSPGGFTTCPSYSGGRKFYGRGFLQLTHDYNYRALEGPLGLAANTLINNPGLLADTTRDLGWRASLVFWSNPNFNGMGSWLSGPTCPAGARAGNLAAVTRRINPIECAGGAQAASQPARIAQVQYVRQKWGLATLTSTLSC